MKISGASIMGRALVVCSVCLFYATAVKADVCFLPTELCYEGAAKVESRDCSSFTDPADKGEGWNCVQCGSSGKYKCTEAPCGSGLSTDVTSCPSDQSLTCNGKSGNKQCCKCEDAALKCAGEGYIYTKTDSNNCQDKCPYNNNYYKICTCSGYDEVSNNNGCNIYATCDLGDSAHEKYYKITGSNRKCNNGSYVTADSPQYTSGENDCTHVCTETCENDRKYYLCTAKKVCNPSEGKYATQAQCEAAVQQTSWVDWLYRTVQNINFIRTSYAATSNNLDLEMCHHCRYDPNPRECYKACMPQTAIDDDPVFPDNPVVPDNPVLPNNDCMVNVAKDCARCVNGCLHTLPCCRVDPIDLDCEDDCNVSSITPSTCTSPNTWEKTGTQSICGNDCYECKAAPNSPCELKDGCWVSKYAGCNETTYPYTYYTASTFPGTGPKVESYQSEYDGYYWLRFQNNYCAVNTTCWNRMMNNPSIIVQGGTGDPVLFNLVKKGSSNCVTGSNVRRFNEICVTDSVSAVSGGGIHNTAGKFREKECSPHRTFTPTCESETYSFSAAGHTVYVNGTKYGVCGACKTGEGYYDSENACQTATGKNCATSNNGGCYQTCESKGLYSTQAACMGGLSDGYACTASGKCYKREITKIIMRCGYYNKYVSGSVYCGSTYVDYASLCSSGNTVVAEPGNCTISGRLSSEGSSLGYTWNEFGDSGTPLYVNAYDAGGTKTVNVPKGEYSLSGSAHH